MSKRTYITSLTAVNNSNIVTVNDGTDLTNISPGDDLRIDGLAGEAVKAITATQIILERNWVGVNKTAVKAINVPTADDFREATKLLRDATVLTASNMSAVSEWTTKMGTVEFTDPANPTETYTVKTVRQLEADGLGAIADAEVYAIRAEDAAIASEASKVASAGSASTSGIQATNAANSAATATTQASAASTAASAASISATLATDKAAEALTQANRAEDEANRAVVAVDSIFGMGQAQFESIRAQNNEQFAASGWVSFGNHESGKQVNECKSGLYTALTTPNTLLIGNTGGVGGSKTDYASVHIEGVVFNLTNQFVLTLPSHPTSAMPERMDMYGVESEKVEISPASPNAYQGGLRGVGASVNLFTATDQQKKDFFAQNSNTTYIGSDGKIYQWQLYRVAFAGTTDGVPSPTEQGYSLNSVGDLWLKDGKNLLYFGNAMRLNDGGYHHLYNPLGAARFVGDTFWYNTAASIASKADCFDPSKLLAGSGSIASGKSGRPEIGGRYYDAVYADGFGGVCRDMRYPAKRVTEYDRAENKLHITNGTARGFEDVLFTLPIVGTSGGQSDSFGIYYSDSLPSLGRFNVACLSGVPDNIKVGSLQHFHRSGDGAILSGVVTGIFPTVVSLRLKGDDNPAWRTYPTDSTLGYTWFCEKNMPQNVGGGMLMSAVYGEPTDLFNRTDLASGWAGMWIPELSTGSISVTLPRKSKSESVLMLYSLNSSPAWSSDVSSSVDSVTNKTIAFGGQAVAVFQYNAFAYQTEDAEIAALWHAADSIGYVTSLNRFAISKGVFAAESMIRKILVSNNDSGGHQNRIQPLTSFNIWEDGFLSSDPNDDLEHVPISLIAPSNSSPAIKYVDFGVRVGKQIFNQFAYTELKHNGTNWGDDGKVTIVDNQAAKMDLNGNTVLVGTAKIKEPIGWLKQKV